MDESEASYRRRVSSPEGHPGRPTTPAGCQRLLKKEFSDVAEAPVRAVRLDSNRVLLLLAPARHAVRARAEERVDRRHRRQQSRREGTRRRRQARRGALRRGLQGMRENHAR